MIKLTYRWLALVLLGSSFNIAHADPAVTMDDLLGTWHGSAYTIYQGAIFSVEGWNPGPDTNYLVLINVTITFWEDAPGHYMVKTSAPWPFHSGDANAHTASVSVVGGVIFGPMMPMELDLITPTTLRMIFNQSGAFSPQPAF